MNLNVVSHNFTFFSPSQRLIPLALLRFLGFINDQWLQPLKREEKKKGEHTLVSICDQASPERGVPAQLRDAAAPQCKLHMLASNHEHLSRRRHPTSPASTLRLAKKTHFFLPA
jgi:hypothetical protein